MGDVHVLPDRASAYQFTVGHTTSIWDFLCVSKIAFRTLLLHHLFFQSDLICVKDLL